MAEESGMEGADNANDRKIELRSRTWMYGSCIVGCRAVMVSCCGEKGWRWIGFVVVGKRCVAVWYVYTFRGGRMDE